MDDDGSDVFFPPRTAVSAASSLRVRINGNKWYHICTADCVGSLQYMLGLFVGTFVCVFFFFCTQVCGDHAYVLGLVCQDQRQAPRVCEVFPSCIAPCLGSPRPLIIPTLALISLPLSPSHTHALFSSFSFCLCFSLPLCDLSVYV